MLTVQELDKDSRVARYERRHKQPSARRLPAALRAERASNRTFRVRVQARRDAADMREIRDAR